MSNSLLLLATLSAAAPVSDVKLPPGFTAHVYSDQALANDIYTMTIDDAGRLIVAGRGYVKLLVDDNGDGKADRAIDLISGLKDGPMGLLAEGDSLYVVADGGIKLYRGILASGGSPPPDATVHPELVYAVKTSGEHEAHAVRRGPDGWLYLMCGNNSGVKKEHLDQQRSPVKDPIAGSLLRISPDFKKVEAVCDGFRNAYSFDFNLDGEPFTFDSDNERCVGLPWYEPCRFYHIVPGGNYGWRSPQLSQTWRKPPYFADVVPPICTTGRGSPTGVACYRNTLFPGRYCGNFFIADWTFGKIWFVPLEKKHSSYTGKPEVFLEAIGESGFAPTALAVHPKTGELFVSIGGRGTRGAVYRVTCDRGDPAKEMPIAKRSLDWDPIQAKQWIKDATEPDAMKRRHALEMMLRWKEKLGWGQWLGDAVKPSLSHDDALVRAAAGRMAVQAFLPVKPLHDPVPRMAFALAEASENPKGAERIALEILSEENHTASERLTAVRLLQLAYGDLTAPEAVGTVWEGYTFRRQTVSRFQRQATEAIVAILKRGDKLTPELQRELGRTLAALGELTSWAPFLFRTSITDKSDITDDIHNLIVLGRTAPLLYLNSVATSLVALDEKLKKHGVRIDTNWPLRVGEMIAAFQPGLKSQRDSFENYLLDNRYFGRPSHILIVRALKLPEQRSARRFIQAASKDSSYAWSPAIVALVGSLPASESRAVLLELWARGGLEDAILLVLAREPSSVDAAKFVAGIRSMNPEVVKVSAAALNKLQPPKDKADVVAAIAALRKLSEDKTSAATREALVALIKNRTGQSFTDAKAWAAWFAKKHPELAAKLNTSDGFDPIAWKKRDAAIPWVEGDPVKGRLAFTKATCAACHDGGGAVGPSLVGISKRFSRDDLLTAIVQPSKDVSPRYRPTRITTTDGKAHMGMIVYEAVSGVMIQTGPDAVVRIAGDQIESQKLLEASLMPAGLLDKLTDREVADLLAYLRTLR
jgi:putative heme-binding domain-containing protein